VPIAVGRILTSRVEMKGKAVQVEHYLYDELWNMGPKKIPEGIKVTKQEGQPEGAQEEVKGIEFEPEEELQ
jgi:ribosomal protein L31E